MWFDPALAVRDRVDLRADVTDDELAGGLHAPVQVDRPDQALEDVGHHRGGRLDVRAHPLADEQELVDPQLLRDLAQVRRETTIDLIRVSSPSR